MPHPPKKTLLLALFFVLTGALALPLTELSNQDAGNGLKSALEKGALAAVGKLGVENGFMNNDQVKIALPAALEKVRPLLKLSGRGKQLDELVVSMNRAAEAAVPMATPLLINAVKAMTFTDAKHILTGGETSVTDFFREKTSAELADKFLPIVKNVTDRSDLAGKYNHVLEQASMLGIAQKAPTVERYVSERALAGLYKMIEEEEKTIRRDPFGSGSALISKVFGALR